MNIDRISSMIQSAVTNSKSADNKIINEGFSSVMISEMLKSTDIFKEEGDMSYPSMFRWQMAQHLAKALASILFFSYDYISSYALQKTLRPD